MESSDIIYLLLAILFTILGIFNESKKKRKKREEKEEKKQTMLSKPFPNDGDIPPWETGENQFETEESSFYPPLPPVVPHVPTTVFDPPLSTGNETMISDGFPTTEMLPPEGVSVFDGSSSDFGSALSASSACSEKQVVYNRHLVDLPQKPHPLIVDLLENMDGEAWKKGILYGEILRKKYD